MGCRYDRPLFPDPAGRRGLKHGGGHGAFPRLSVAVTPTPRDEQILAALCTRVRLFNLPQIAETWWADAADPAAAARRRLAKLAAVDLVNVVRAAAAPLPPLDGPVLSWCPGESDPDCGSAAHRLRTRWLAAGPRATDVYVAGKSAAGVYGGAAAGKLKTGYQATHDLGVSEMYLRLVRESPADAARWVGEDRLAPHYRGGKLPDAALADRPDAPPDLVLEFGGAYDKRASHGLPPLLRRPPPAVRGVVMAGRNNSPNARRGAGQARGPRL